jgi:uncharacterized damage-inducible protein DinB
MNEFERDLAENLKSIETARAQLLDGLRPLAAEDLRLGRRGGWSNQEVLRHVIDAEIAYAKVIGFLRSRPVELANASDDDVASARAAVSALERTREQLVSLLDGVDEATFYDMRSLGTNQYSVMSVLENVADHDHEHLGQITKTLASGGTSR